MTWRIRPRLLGLGLLVAILTLGVLVAFPVHTAHALTVVIPDANLQQVIRNTLQKDAGPITDEDMRMLVDLDCFSAEIANLAGLEYATNLEFANFNSNLISRPPASREPRDTAQSRSEQQQDLED